MKYPVIIQFDNDKFKAINTVNQKGFEGLNDDEFKNYSRFIFDHFALSPEKIDPNIILGITKSMSERNIKLSNIAH